MRKQAESQAVPRVGVRSWRVEIQGAIFAHYLTLRRRAKGDTDAVRSDITRLEARVTTLDDRVYALAVGLKPLINEAGDKPRS